MNAPFIFSQLVTTCTKDELEEACISAVHLVTKDSKTRKYKTVRILKPNSPSLEEFSFSVFTKFDGEAFGVVCRLNHRVFLTD